jgi:hypothetical protein
VSVTAQTPANPSATPVEIFHPSQVGGRQLFRTAAISRSFATNFDAQLLRSIRARERASSRSARARSRSSRRVTSTLITRDHSDLGSVIVGSDFVA